MLQLRYEDVISAMLCRAHMRLFQARSALCSSTIFSRMDTVTDSECFYNSVLKLFEDADQKEEVGELLVWWNR